MIRLKLYISKQHLTLNETLIFLKIVSFSFNTFILLGLPLVHFDMVRSCAAIFLLMCSNSSDPTFEINFKFWKQKMLYSDWSGEHRVCCASIIQYFTKKLLTTKYWDTWSKCIENKLYWYKDTITLLVWRYNHFIGIKISSLYWYKDIITLL